MKIWATVGLIGLLALGAFAYTATKSSADKIKCPLTGQVIEKSQCPLNHGSAKCCK